MSEFGRNDPGHGGLPRWMHTRTELRTTLIFMRSVIERHPAMPGNPWHLSETDAVHTRVRPDVVTDRPMVGTVTALTVDTLILEIWDSPDRTDAPADVIPVGSIDEAASVLTARIIRRDGRDEGRDKGS